MLETRDLILDKAGFSDWKKMYHNVWSSPECARYMAWQLTTSEDEARARMRRTLEYQKNHDAYFVYLRSTGSPIGFAGVERISPSQYGETGICLGDGYRGKGYGKQVLQCLLAYCREEPGAKEFIYTAREENEASKRLALAMGLSYVSSEVKTDIRDGRAFTLVKYRLDLKKDSTG